MVRLIDANILDILSPLPTFEQGKSKKEKVKSKILGWVNGCLLHNKLLYSTSLSFKFQD